MGRTESVVALSITPANEADDATMKEMTTSVADTDGDTYNRKVCSIEIVN